jgi:hypothetical protein
MENEQLNIIIGNNQVITHVGRLSLVSGQVVPGSFFYITLRQ